VGIKIFKPSIYLGSTKLSVENISKIKKKIIEDKIGSKFIHIENKKNILEMSYTVAKKALNKEKQKPNFLIFVCQGQDNIFPSAAEKLAFMLGLKKDTFILTISAGCSGFVQAVILANKLLNKKNKNGLIICAEKYSKYILQNDIKTRVLFSDAASATFVQFNKKKNYHYEIYGHQGDNSDALMIKKINGMDKLSMNGQKVFLFGINNVPDGIKKISKNIKIDKYLIHPGSKIMLDSIVKKSLINPIKVYNSFHITGNTVSSSIPLLINLNYKKLLNKNILLSGFGVGLSWATIAIKWI
jgi:3-oxoacyl-[acyl-carrier-protein] synthase III